MLIDADNNCTGWASVEEAVANDDCFCVPPRDNLLVLDADKHWQVDTVEAISQRLIAEGLRPVVLASGQLHRRHLFCSVRDPSLLRSIREEARSAGIDTRSRSGARIRPPFTRHRLGKPVYLLYPVTVEEALDSLASDDWDAYETPRLTTATWHLLQRGDPDVNSSDLVWRIACGAAAVGYPPEKLYLLLRDEENVGGQSLQKRLRKSEQLGHKWFFEYVWPKALAFVKEHPTFEGREEAVQALLSMAEEIDQYTWESLDLPATAYEKPSRIGGASMRKLLTGIMELAIEFGTVTPYLAQHYLEERVGMDRKTVARALRGLEILGWHKLIERGKGLKAHTYRLLVGQDRLNSPIPIRGSMSLWGTKSVGHDVFQRGGGIGEAGRRLLSVMSAVEAGTVKALAAFARVNEGYSRKVLHRMEAVG